MQKEPIGPGEESAWDYPRPPRTEKESRLIEIFFNSTCLARTTSAWRCLETSHPPCYYIPQEDIKMEHLTKLAHHTFCEFKGNAEYWSINVNGVIKNSVAWSYPNPTNAYAPLKDHLCFYASKMERCLIGGQIVQPQEGDFYGGWITHEIKGPFKGAPGTWGW